jgi:Fe-S cluster assembly protein SufD
VSTLLEDTHAAVDGARQLVPTLASLADAAARGGAPLSDVRRAGADAFARVGVPTTRNEDWHYTNPAEVVAVPYVSAEARAVDTLPSASALLPYAFGGQWPVLVFVNGRYVPQLSSLRSLPDGVRVLDLARAAREEPELVARHVSHAADVARDGFTALNAAFIGEGAFVHVAKEMVSDTPLHLLHVMDAHGTDVMAHPRHVIVVDRHAKATVVESFIALEEVRYFTNVVTEVYVEDGATLTHLRVQRESRAAYFVGTVEARQGRDSHFQQFTFQTGGALSRSNVFTVLGGDGCGTTLNGLYMLDGAQHGDHQTRVEHVAPNCFSRELYKGLLDGRSHGVFNGKVYVHPAAQKTDGKQTNNTLLLSEQAQIDTKPQLEIFADDVKCTHGATVGRIDALAQFYLKSRGIGPVLSKQLLMYAFAADVLETIENDAIRVELERMTLARFTGAN